jgi:fumarate hydratase subunit beta
MNRERSLKHIKITTPLSPDTVRTLKAGDCVLISGSLLTGRDAAHKRFCALLEKGEKLPVDLKGRVIFFVGPTPPPPGKVIGSAGPTTSGRMDAYSPSLIEKCGLAGMIGKGARSAAVLESMKKGPCVYFAATGGAGALLSKCVVSSKVVCYEDLGPEAVHLLEVRDFPAIVASDCHGGDLYRR